MARTSRPPRTTSRTQPLSSCAHVQNHHQLTRCRERRTTHDHGATAAQALIPLLEFMEKNVQAWYGINPDKEVLEIPQAESKTKQVKKMASRAIATPKPCRRWPNFICSLPVGQRWLTAPRLPSGCVLLQLPPCLVRSIGKEWLSRRLLGGATSTIFIPLILPIFFLID